MSKGAYNRNKKNVSKRAIAVLIEKRFSFTGLKSHNKSNSFQYLEQN